MSTIQPLPWSRDQYGSLIDAKGERICLTGVSIATGRVASDDPCHANTELLFSAAARLAAAEQMAQALREFVAAGVGNSTDYLKQGAAHALAVRCIAAWEQSKP